MKLIRKRKARIQKVYEKLKEFKKAEEEYIRSYPINDIQRYMSNKIALNLLGKAFIIKVRSAAMKLLGSPEFTNELLCISNSNTFSIQLYR